MASRETALVCPPFVRPPRSAPGNIHIHCGTGSLSLILSLGFKGAAVAKPQALNLKPERPQAARLEGCDLTHDLHRVYYMLICPSP